MGKIIIKWIPEFMTMYNTSSGLWGKGQRQPKNHLGHNDFNSLCGIKGVEWMGGTVTFTDIIADNGVCKKCLKKAAQIAMTEDTGEDLNNIDDEKE